MERTVDQRVKDNPDFQLMLNTGGDALHVGGRKYDAIVCATGSREKTPGVEGLGEGRVRSSIAIGYILA